MPRSSRSPTRNAPPSAAAAEPAGVRNRIPFHRDFSGPRTVSYGGPPSWPTWRYSSPRAAVVAIVASPVRGRPRRQRSRDGPAWPRPPGARDASNGPRSPRVWRSRSGTAAGELPVSRYRAQHPLGGPHATDLDLALALRSRPPDSSCAAARLERSSAIAAFCSREERQRLRSRAPFCARPKLLILYEATSRSTRRTSGPPDATECLRGQVAMLLSRTACPRAPTDMIYVLDAGRVVETGNWDQLMARTGGRFRALCLAQGLDSPPAAVSARPVAVM